MELLVLSIIGTGIVFVFFLVIVRTLGSVNNHLTKVEYWISQELEFIVEQRDVRRALEMDEADNSGGIQGNDSKTGA